MRALCGAIITAGALIGLGLSAVGIGMRYQNFARWESEAQTHHVRWGEMDTGLIYVLVILTIATVIGMAIAFLGLAYHHHRRHHELLHLTGGGRPPATPTTTTTP
jgi:hypothetical protein